MGPCLSLFRRRRKEHTDASCPPVPQETKTTRGDEEFLHRVTREDSLKHLVRHPRIHPFSAVDKFGFNGAYESVKLLGRGGTGATWLCKDMKTPGKMVAIKLQQRPIPESSVKTTYNEIIVQGNESEGCVFATTIREVVLTPQFLGLVLEYENGGTLAEYIASRVGKVGPLDLAVQESQALYFFKQLVAGVSYLHKHHTAHRDIKLDNTLLNADNPMQPPTLKLVSFSQFVCQLLSNDVNAIVT